MPANTKCRRVCMRPPFERFAPEGAAESVRISLEELEALRLCDLEGLDQELAARRMEVSRGTLQRIIYSAHAKVAEALCRGKCIEIGGGNFEFAAGWCGGRPRCALCPFWSESERVLAERMKNIVKDGRIAVTEENGEVFQHFGHTRYFALYEIKDGAVAKKSMLDAEGSGHSALGGFMRDNGVDLLICGGIGSGARNFLADQHIELIAGISGPTDEAVKKFLAGDLHDDTAGSCDHHSHDAPAGECRGCGQERHSHGCN